MSTLSTQQLQILLMKANRGLNVPYSILEIETELLTRSLVSIIRK